MWSPELGGPGSQQPISDLGIHVLARIIPWQKDPKQLGGKRKKEGDKNGSRNCGPTSLELGF